MINDSGEWVSLRQAADILGVHPATVRNWADEGKITSRRTPGNHRRFRKADLLNYADSHDELQPTEVKVIIQSALGHTRMQVGSGNLTDAVWYERMSEATRNALRQQGRQVLEALREYLAHGAPDANLAAAIKLGKDYARLLSDDELTLPQAVRGFFYFNDFVVNSVLAWSEITPPRSAADWGNVLRQVNTFTNTMLLSIIEYYEEE